MDKFIETYGERPDGHGGLPTMTTRAQDTWDALRAAYELGRRETEIDPHIDGVVPQPITYEEEFFLSGMLAGNLRRIYAAHDDEGNDLSALPAKAADEIERLHVRVVNMNEALQRVKGRVCGEKHPYWSDSQRVFVSRGFIADVCDMALLTPSNTLSSGDPPDKQREA